MRHGFHGEAQTVNDAISYFFFDSGGWNYYFSTNTGRTSQITEFFIRFKQLFNVPILYLIHLDDFFSHIELLSCMNNRIFSCFCRRFILIIYKERRLGYFQNVSCSKPSCYIKSGEEFIKCFLILERTRIVDCFIKALSNIRIDSNTYIRCIIIRITCILDVTNRIRDTQIVCRISFFPNQCLQVTKIFGIHVCVIIPCQRFSNLINLSLHRG